MFYYNLSSPMINLKPMLSETSIGVLHYGVMPKIWPISLKVISNVAYNRRPIMINIEMCYIKNKILLINF